MSKELENSASDGGGSMDVSDAIQLGVILLFLVGILLFGGYSMAAMKVTPSASTSVTEVQGESGVYEVTIVCSDCGDGIYVAVEGTMEKRVIESGGETFRVDAGEDGQFQVVEYYNPDTIILSEWYSSQYVLFDSKSEK